MKLNMEESKQHTNNDSNTQPQNEDNANPIQKEPFIDPERVNPDIYRDAIDIGQKQIKAIANTLNNIVSQKKKRLKQILDYHQANCDRLQQLHNTIQAFSELTVKKEDALYSFNLECSNKILKANEIINSKTAAISICNESISKHDAEITKTLEEIKSKVHVIDKKKIEPLIKTAKADSNITSILQLAAKLATGYPELTGENAIEVWKNLDLAKAKLLEYNCTLPSNMNYIELDANLTQNESKLTDKDIEIRNISAICRLMIKASIDNISSVKYKKDMAIVWY